MNSKNLCQRPRVWAERPGLLQMSANHSQVFRFCTPTAQWLDNPNPGTLWTTTTFWVPDSFNLDTPFSRTIAKFSMVPGGDNESKVVGNETHERLQECSLTVKCNTVVISLVPYRGTGNSKYPERLWIYNLMRASRLWIKRKMLWNITFYLLAPIQMV